MNEGIQEKKGNVKSGIAAPVRIVLLVTFAALSLFLTGCISEEEEKKAQQNINTGKRIIAAYLEENYEGECMIEDVTAIPEQKMSDTIPNFRTYVSDYTIGKIQRDNGHFYVIANVRNGECYDNYYEPLINEQMKAYLEPYMGKAADTADIEVHFYDIDIKGIRSGVYNGFFYNGIQTLEDAFADGTYSVYVVYKYIDTDEVFEEIPLTDIYESMGDTKLYLGCVNFWEKDRFLDGIIGAEDGFDTLAVKKGSYYRLKDIMLADEQTAFYSHRKSETISGVEYIWDKAAYDVTLSETSAAELVETDEGVPFRAKEAEGIKADIHVKTIEKDGSAGNKIAQQRDIIYCFFPLDKKDETMIVSGGENEWIWVWHLDAEDDDCCYRYLEPEEDITYEFGWYEKAAS